MQGAGREMDVAGALAVALEGEDGWMDGKCIYRKLRGNCE